MYRYINMNHVCINTYINHIYMHVHTYEPINKAEIVKSLENFKDLLEWWLHPFFLQMFCNI